MKRLIDYWGDSILLRTFLEQFDNLFNRYSQRSDAKLKIRTIFTQETYNDFRQLITTDQAYIEWQNLSKNNRYWIPFKSLG